MSLATRVALGLLIGTLVGAIFGPSAAVVEPLGTAFIKIVRMLVVPLIATSLIQAVAGMRARGALGRMGVRAFGFIFISLLLALTIGMFWGMVMRPGAGLTESVREALVAGQESPDVGDATRISLVDQLLTIVPSNMIAAAVEGNVLQVLFVSILVGLAAGALSEERRRSFLDITGSFAQIMFKLVAWSLQLAPFGVFGIMAAVVGRSGLAILSHLAQYVLVVALGLVTQMLLVYLPVLTLLARQGLPRFLRAARAPLLIAFPTCSTAVALPISMRSMETEMGVSSRVTSFVLPLGAALGRDGSGIYQAISVIFIAQVYGQSLGWSALATLIVTATLSALAVAPVPAASFVNLTILLTALGLPLEGAAVILGVERPLDMVRTSTNLLGQLVNATYVASAEGELESPSLSDG